MENDKELDELYVECEQFYKDRAERDAKVLEVVKSVFSRDEFNDILSILEECDDTYDYSIEDSPKGDYQEEDHDFIKGAWVNQTTNGGYTGDEFAGTVSIKLPNDKYFQFYYSHISTLIIYNHTLFMFFLQWLFYNFFIWSYIFT